MLGGWSVAYKRLQTVFVATIDALVRVLGTTSLPQVLLEEVTLVTKYEQSTTQVPLHISRSFAQLFFLLQPSGSYLAWSHNDKIHYSILYEKLIAHSLAKLYATAPRCINAAIRKSSRTTDKQIKQRRIQAQYINRNLRRCRFTSWIPSSWPVEIGRASCRERVF